MMTDVIERLTGWLGGKPGLKTGLTIVCGALIALGSVWAGSFTIHKVGIESWAGFPAVLTTVIAFFAGIALSAKGIADLGDL